MNSNLRHGLVSCGRLLMSGGVAPPLERVER
jgi:hypothetical protein